MELEMALDMSGSSALWRSSSESGNVSYDLTNALIERGGCHMEVFPGVTMDPDVRFGKPCLAGTRIDIATIVGYLSSGQSIESTAADYLLSTEQVLTALRFATHIAAHLPPAVRQAS